MSIFKCLSVYIFCTDNGPCDIFIHHTFFSHIDSQYCTLPPLVSFLLLFFPNSLFSSHVICVYVCVWRGACIWNKTSTYEIQHAMYVFLCLNCCIKYDGIKPNVLPSNNSFLLFIIHAIYNIICEYMIFCFLSRMWSVK